MGLTVQINTENYYSVQVSREYLSVSQFKAWCDCPDFAFHRYIVGDVKDESYQPFIVGSFLHTLFEGKEAHASFKFDHPELISSRGATVGKLKKEYQDAEESYRIAKRNKNFMRYMTGEHEVIFTADFGPVQWAIRVDVLNREAGFMSDLKYIRDLDGEFWMSVNFDLQGNPLPPDAEGVEVMSKNVRVPFYEAYQYWQRFAVYASVLYKATGKSWDLFMPVVSKDVPPALRVYSFNNRVRLAHELEMVNRKLPEIVEYRKGNNLWKCGKCPHCRKNCIVEEPIEATSIW